MANLLTTNFFIGLVLGIMVGAIVGFLVARNSKASDQSIKAVQLLSILTLFGYIGLSYIYGKDPSPLGMGMILATGYGAKGGELIEKFLDRSKGKEKGGNDDK